MSESAYLVLESVGLELPVYNADSRSFKKTMVGTATGGSLKVRSRRVSVRALRSISFSLNEGDRLGLIGANGAGKTSLLRLLAGIYKPTSGQMAVSGKVDSLLAIGAGMDMEQNAEENIRLKLMIHGSSKSEVASATQAILDFADLGEFAKLPVRTYSSGMLVRLGFSISTTIEPEILLMDEWLSAGDADFGNKAQHRIAQVVGSSKILVIASHSRATIERSCNKVAWLESGYLKMLGESKEVLDSYFGASHGK
jgi:lipopolysaccharide transport system ATP-binding protein